MQAPQRIGVDETSFQKRHEYVTVVNDLDGHVLHVADGRGKESLEEFHFDAIQTVANMWGRRESWRTVRSCCKWPASGGLDRSRFLAGETISG